MLPHSRGRATALAISAKRVHGEVASREIRRSFWEELQNGGGRIMNDEGCYLFSPQKHGICGKLRLLHPSLRGKPRTAGQQDGFSAWVFYIKVVPRIRMCHVLEGVAPSTPTPDAMTPDDSLTL